MTVLASEDVSSTAFKMEPMLRAIESVEVSSKGVAASFDHGVGNDKPCTEFILEVVLPIEEEEDDVKSEPCKEVKLEVAVPVGEEEVVMDQEVVNAEPCQVLEPEAVVTDIVANDSEIVANYAEIVANGAEIVANGAEIVANDVYLTVEDCSGELQKHLPANGSGDGGGGADGATMDGNSSKICGASESKINPPGDEILIDLGLAPSSPPSESLPSLEPAWGDVPDEPVAVPDTAPATPRFLKRPRHPAENVEVDDVVQNMRNILMDLRNADDARLSPEDEEKVRSLLEYHPKAEEKTGSGIDHIKIKRHSTFTDVRCFWVVRTDGSETDFSYHKCLKEKVAKLHPTFVDRYDAIYRAPKRPRRA